MERCPNVLIVARADDGVAIRLRHALENGGRQVSHVSGPAAARMFTIRVGADSTSVSPSLPVFARESAWWDDEPPREADDVFLRSEEYSTFWAAAALLNAPVINRPGRNGTFGRMTWGPIGRTLNWEPEKAGSEVYASGPEVLEDGGGIWGEDLNFISAPVRTLRDRVPVRARRVSLNALYEIITIVGTRAFSATDDPRTRYLDLAGQSLRLAQQVKIHFATVTWAIDDTGAYPVRLNAEPDETELRYAWNEVAPALCEDLTP